MSEEINPPEAMSPEQVEFNNIIKALEQLTLFKNLVSMGTWTGAYAKSVSELYDHLHDSYQQVFQRYKEFQAKHGN